MSNVEKRHVWLMWRSRLWLLLLREHHDAAVPAVHQVRQHEVDETVRAAEGDGGLRAVSGQGANRLPSPPARTMANTLGPLTPGTLTKRCLAR